MAADPLMFISLDGIRLYGYHGVMEQERVVGAEYELTVILTLPPVVGCFTDDLNDTLSYADLFDLVRREFDYPCKLLEHLVQNIADATLRRWQQVQKVYVKVSKLAPPITGCQGSASVALTIDR